MFITFEYMYKKLPRGVLVNLRFICFYSVFLIFKAFTSPTSITDIDTYKNICHLAAEDEKEFMTFKRHPAYTQILEHVSLNEGRDYLNLINHNKNIMSLMKHFKINDIFGSPRQMFAEDVGMISPTTLRYIKVLSDLSNQLGTLNDLNIVEIGGGYGGQCLIISKMFNFKTYTIIDLKEPLELAKKYLDLHGVKNVNYINFFDIKNEIKDVGNFDLLISNYAFTECHRDIQDIYFEKVISKSKAGYITSNAEVWGKCCYKTNEIMAHLKKCFSLAKTVPEQPLTAPGNCILIW
jgi:hypothetical protein